MSEPNIVCTGAGVVACAIDADSGVISELTPRGIPQFIEIGFKDGNVLKIYADGSHSDQPEFRFVKYQAPSNYSARKWLFERYLKEHFSFLWQLYRFVRWQYRVRRRAFTWYLNKTEKCPHTFYGWSGRDDVISRRPSLRLPRWRPKRQSCFCRCCCGKGMTDEEIHRICEMDLDGVTWY